MKRVIVDVSKATLRYEGNCTHKRFTVHWFRPEDADRQFYAWCDVCGATLAAEWDERPEWVPLPMMEFLPESP